ncbi:probable WRKY transcription factor 20 isoform X2 [Ricinus communis]|uniref:WRKY transcription factor, putative n=1 Tax=Ricinus communis TaxID=3988 RepID=B9SSS9_RICCO|nr:probable WRKY transcription factor 20 isoform X2 [Ricinus communis]EEF33359.1 WRKY transcription factor, putative [Ricinus communis]|eukprot:XP_002529048.1 probable WRKY transcription factor 20 isoform X2 [Ricinus communis]
MDTNSNNSGDPSRLDSDSGSAASVGGARYKLMSPAKLPISRSPCITIPPGLSPTSFLESPVLLSNVKAEPSPTTGSFAKPPTGHGSLGSNPYSATAVPSNAFGERTSSCFEFRPHPRSNLVPADVHHRITEQSVQVQGHCQNQSLASSPRVKSEMAVSSNEFSLSAPLPSSGTSAPGEVESDELNQIGVSNNGLQASQTDHKGGSGISMPSDDGYNWRKYGQKHVKGSEFPRSYYKCTHPNCEVKKLFERSHDGQITEIIYKGTHDHPKPQPSRRYSSGAVLSMQEDRSDKILSLPGRDDKTSIAYGQVSHTIDPNGTPELSPVTANDDSIEGAEDDDDPFSKRRKMDTGGFEVTPVVKPIREPRVVVQTLSEVDILDDGYRWRKYGQKVVRGNPNPRSYYKCTNAGCPVRKHVERASHDPKAVITTYEGKHNHDVPMARTSSHDTTGPTAVNGASRIRSEESETISLDLGVGISSTTDNRSNDQQQALHSELSQSQNQASGSSFRIVPRATIAPYYGVLNGGMNQYGSRQNPNEGRSVEIPPLSHSSYPYPQNVGRLLTGP